MLFSSFIYAIRFETSGPYKPEPGPALDGYVNYTPGARSSGGAMTRQLGPRHTCVQLTTNLGVWSEKPAVAQWDGRCWNMDAPV